MLNTLTRLKYNVYKLVQNYLIQSKPKLRKYDQPRYLQLYMLSIISQMIHDVMTKVCVESYVYGNSHNHAQVHVIIVFLTLT